MTISPKKLNLMSVHYLDFNKKELELQNGVWSLNTCYGFS